MTEIPSAAARVLDRLEGRGFSAYLVGGCVRDGLRGIVPHDWDVATSARPADIEDCFRDCRVLTVGARHGTVSVEMDGMWIEVTTFRVDGAYSDGRHPDCVSFSDALIDDLSRRDFTVNAMAYNPHEGLIDCFGARADLERGQLRAVGVAQLRFEEDALRILRALRFRSEHGFVIESETDAAMRRCAPLLARIAVERVAAEWNRILLGDAAGEILLEYRELLAVSVPEVRPMFDFAQHSPYHDRDVWAHTAAAVAAAPPVLTVRLAALLHDIAKPRCFSRDETGRGHFYGHPAAGADMARDILRRLHYDTKTVHTVELLIRWHDVEIPPTERAVRRWMQRIGAEQLGLLLELKCADRLAHAAPHRDIRAFRECAALCATLTEQGACVSVQDLAINGNDLMALGVPEGRAVGDLLKRLTDAVIDGMVDNDRAALLARANEEWGTMQ